jgi:allophanate hydrolase subunit 1
VIGRSPVPLWQRRPPAAALLAPGDKVCFAPVSLREYEELSTRLADGTLEIVPSETAAEVALGAAA